MWDGTPVRRYWRHCPRCGCRLHGKQVHTSFVNRRSDISEDEDDSHTEGNCSEPRGKRSASRSRRRKIFRTQGKTTVPSTVTRNEKGNTRIDTDSCSTAHDSTVQHAEALRFHSAADSTQALPFSVSTATCIGRTCCVIGIRTAGQGMKRAADSLPGTPRERPAGNIGSPASLVHFQVPPLRGEHDPNFALAWSSLATIPCSDSNHPFFTVVLNIVLRMGLLQPVTFAWRWRSVAWQGIWFADFLFQKFAVDTQFFSH